MNLDDVISSLPDDPDAAFSVLERAARKLLGTGQTNADKITYMDAVKTAASYFGIEPYASWKLPEIIPASTNTNTTNVLAAYSTFRNSVDAFQLKHKPAVEMTRRKNIIELKEVDRERIRHYVERIKAALEVADLPPERKDKLLSMLNGFLAEVDKRRTSMQAVAAMWVSVCSAVGEGFAHLEPARKWLDDIATIMGAAKAISHDVKALPAPETQALPAPEVEI